MGELIDKEDLIAALSEPTVINLYDDDRDGVADEDKIEFNVARAESQVWSYLIGHYTLGDDARTDMLLKSCALDYLVSYSFDRKPEYVRTHGDAPRQGRIERADETMMRIKAGVQRPPKLEEKQVSATVGGVIYDPVPVRMFIPGPDGTDNNGIL